MNLRTGARWTLQLLMMVVLLSIPALADDIQIDFIGLGSGGAIKYTGNGVAGDAIMTASGVKIGLVNGYNTPANADLVSPVTGPTVGVGTGVLNFSTGTLSSYDTVAKEYTFSGGGLIEIWGTVAAAGINSYTKLLWGNVLGAVVDQFGSIKLAMIEGVDFKDPALVSWFGLDPVETKFAFSGSMHLAGFTLGAIPGSPLSFSAISNGSTNITNAVAPEPASLALLGSALVFISWRLRKKFLQKNV